MKKKILVVEDDKDINRAISIRLRSAGYKVSSAFDGLMGISVAAKESPDLAILDISMPAGNGLDLAERMKMLNQTSNTPFIVITASKRPTLKDRARELGCSAFIEKPYLPETLLAEVKKALGEVELAS